MKDLCHFAQLFKHSTYDNRFSSQSGRSISRDPYSRTSDGRLDEASEAEIESSAGLNHIAGKASGS